MFFDDAQKAEAMYAEGVPLTPEDIATAVEFVLTASEHVQVHDVLLRPRTQVD